MESQYDVAYTEIINTYNIRVVKVGQYPNERDRAASI